MARKRKHPSAGDDASKDNVAASGPAWPCPACGGSGSAIPMVGPQPCNRYRGKGRRSVDGKAGRAVLYNVTTYGDHNQVVTEVAMTTDDISGPSEVSPSLFTVTWGPKKARNRKDKRG